MRLTKHLFTIIGPLILIASPLLADGNDSFLAQLNSLRTVGSTVPANGDVNPYGVAVVPATIGKLVRGDVLVSNFNNSANLQGTGTTIDQIGPNGDVKLFATLEPASLPGACPGGVGLTTALVALRSGWVIVGSLPTTDGTAATAKAGCLIVLNHSGQPVMTLEGNGINGPWDMSALDLGEAAVLFVTNVLNGTVAANGAVVDKGSVLRIVLVTPTIAGAMPREIVRTAIATRFGERTDPAALVIGPTGVGLAGDGTLYVADTLANRIAAIPDALFRQTDAGAGVTVSAGKALNGPLGLAIAPNGDILTANGGDGNMVETTRGGAQVAVKAVDVSHQGGGTLFGLALTLDGPGVYFVDEGNNTLNILR